jgi:integrase
MTRRRSFQNGCLIKRKGKWVIRWRERVPAEGGELRWKHRAETLGLVRNLTKGEAETTLRERLAELNPLAQFPTRDTEFTELLERWEKESLPNKSLSTQDGYRKIVTKHLKPFFGPYSLREISPSLIQRFVQDRVKSGLTPQTTRNIYNTLRAVLNFGKRLKYVKENPADGVELPRRAERERNVLRPEDVLAILDAFRNDGMSKALVLCAYLTGLRRGEISGLKWQDVDFLANVIRPQQAVWNGQECGLKSKAAYKPLPLPQKLREVLLELRGESKYRQDGNYVFTARNGKPVNLSNWGRRRLKPLQKRLALPEISLHCFRHTHSTQLNALGTDPKTLQTQLRHANPEITLGRYTHQVPELQKAAVQQLEEKLYRQEEKTQLFSTVLN